MALDIITQRSSNNIFGKDLWGLSTSGEGLYGGVLSTEHLYSAGTRALLKHHAELNNIKDPMILQTLPQAYENWKKNNPYIIGQHHAFTDTNVANNVRLNLGIQSQNRPLDITSWTGRSFQMPDKSTIKQSIFGTRSMNDQVNTTFNRAFNNHFWGLVGGGPGGGGGGSGPGGGGPGGGGFGGGPGGKGPRHTQGGPHNTNDMFKGMPPGFIDGRNSRQTQGGPNNTNDMFKGMPPGFIDHRYGLNTKKNEGEQKNDIQMEDMVKTENKYKPEPKPGPHPKREEGVGGMEAPATLEAKLFSLGNYTDPRMQHMVRQIRMMIQQYKQYPDTFLNAEINSKIMWLRDNPKIII